MVTTVVVLTSSPQSSLGDGGVRVGEEVLKKLEKQTPPKSLLAGVLTNSSAKEFRRHDSSKMIPSLEMTSFTSDLLPI
ncbi:hypothetical protein R6Q57_009010 [Mikania cordata]